ncbi:arginine kinase 1 isoform X2 [Toxorhynchites rutilus septentrionalis]|nr:arginine kinase 1 isoform X2 [Toxorhynchites rutilus septentrionalis]
MFALWYFSLAMEEIRKRFNFVNRIFLFFYGDDSVNQTPAIEPQQPEQQPEKEPVDSSVATPVSPVANISPPKVSLEPIKPTESPVKPAPVVPTVSPSVIEPAKPKEEIVLPAVKPDSVKPNIQPKRDVLPGMAAVDPISTKVQDLSVNGHGKNKLSEPVALDSRVQPPKPIGQPLPQPQSFSKIVELPTNNEDSFIIVEKQKPKATNVKNSTLDFLKAEGSAGAARPTPRNKSDTMVDAAVLEKLEAGFAKLAASDSKSLLKKHLTKEIFDSLKNKKTSFGSTLLDCIQSGVENLDSGFGIYAPDADAYTVFADIFDPMIEEYHMGFKKTDKHPASDFGDVSTFGNVDPTGEFVVSTRVRCGRSMQGYPFNPCLTEAQYKEMEDKVSATLSGLEGELKGKFYPLTGMEKSVQQQLIDDHFLFKEGDRFLQAANACRFWPTGRGIYHNDNKTFLVWCNEEDHLRIISMQMGGDLGQVYRRLVTAVNDIEKRVPFSHHDRLGFLTFCPTNLGTTIRASVHIKVPKLAKDYAKLESIAAKYNLQVRGTRGEHTEAEGGIYDISNKRRMGLTEYQAVKEMYDGISELIKIEKSL